MQISIQTLVNTIVCVTLLAGCGDKSSPAVDDAEETAAPEALTLYSIDGGERTSDKAAADKEKFHGYAVLGKVEVKDAAARREIFDALNKGIADSDGELAKCFWPRRAIRVVDKGATTDYVICFECYQLHRHAGDDRKTVPTTRKPQSVFNKHLKAAGVPLAGGMAKGGE